MPGGAPSILVVRAFRMRTAVKRPSSRRLRIRIIRIREAHGGEARCRRVALLHRTIRAIDTVCPTPAPFLQADPTVPAISLCIDWNRRQNREHCQNRQSQNAHQNLASASRGNACGSKSWKHGIVPKTAPARGRSRAGTAAPLSFRGLVSPLISTAPILRKCLHRIDSTSFPRTTVAMHCW
jgi:hypothetical protein